MLKRSLLAAPLLALAFLAQGCIIVDDDGDATFVVDNQSDWALYEVRIAPIDDPRWGPDLTGSDILLPGEFIEIFDIECDFYDALVVDEVGAECVIYDLDLCANDSTWVITNGGLSSCPIFAARIDEANKKKAEAAAEADSAATTLLP